jgi:acyl-CoA synthetase (AMP-forming)/AMP-acid ligase II
VVGAPDEHWGESVVAFLTVSGTDDVDVEALREHCRALLPAYKVPSRFITCDELPVNASGKVVRRELRARLRR